MKNKFVILGSANAVPKLGQDNTHLVLEAGDKLVMVDCGDNPISKMAESGFSILEVSDIVLTHFHADHVGSLPVLLMGMWLEKRQKPLIIHGLEITLSKAQQLLDLFSWKDWPNMFPVEFSVIAETGQENFINTKVVSITALPVLHLIPTIGLRFSFTGSRTIAYSCDSEPCENLDKLAAGADILLHEAAGEAKGHSSASQAGNTAEKAGVKKLILIHYDSRVDEALLLRSARLNFSGEVVLARDLLVV